MERTFFVAALAAAAVTLAPGVAPAQEEPAESSDPAVPPYSYATEDDFYFTQALFCAIKRCGFGSYTEAAAYAEAGWDRLRAEGHGAEALLDHACRTEGPCGADPYTATLLDAPGARTDLVVEPTSPAPPPPPGPAPAPPEPEPAPEVVVIEVEEELHEAPHTGQTRQRTAFIRPNLQFGLGGGLVVLPGPSDTGRLLMPRVLAGGMLDHVMARAVASWGVGFDEEYQFYRAMHLGFQAGPMFGDDEGRVYVAGSLGSSWLQVDYGLLRGQYGGIEVGAHVLMKNRVAMAGWFVGTEIHGVAMNTFLQYPDGTIVHAGRPYGINLYCGVQFGF